ncbi:phosphoribosyltransferase family protein [Pyrodictium abyssi]|uniref:Phosphoribosyltransferase domain-containing protein n=1 Tax=Pyrodictium abyssi TaxID=54256 RepID=A0ABN6ZT24_9CREN|nr:hypothetical protein PABY_13400 [Pyrodictium abyssi]
MNRVDELRLRLEAVELLRLLRRWWSLRELEEITGLPRGVLAHYVSGNRVPSGGQARLIVERVLERLPPSRLLGEKVRGQQGMLDLQELVLDPLVLRLASLWASRRYRGRVTKVLAAETAGVPLATAIALSLDADLVLARRSRENPYRDYLRGEAGEPPFNVKVFYVTAGSLEKSDQVLLVDDLARSGATLEALAKIVHAAGAEPVAAMVLIALGGEWRRRLAALVPEAVALLELG